MAYPLYFGMMHEQMVGGMGVVWLLAVVALVLVIALLARTLGKPSAR